MIFNSLDFPVQETASYLCGGA